MAFYEKATYLVKSEYLSLIIKPNAWVFFLNSERWSHSINRYLLARYYVSGTIQARRYTTGALNRTYPTPPLILLSRNEEDKEYINN